MAEKPHRRTRRHLLALTLAAPFVARAASSATAADMEGPYYPPERPTSAGNNLRAVPGKPAPFGQPLDLEGRVLDRQGKPLAGVLVEIWQTDGRGNYIHPAASLQPGTERDPGFAGYGRAIADVEGRWRFMTLRPIGYFGRPPHIHVKLWSGTREVLTTQLYFPDAGGRRALMVTPLPAQQQGVARASFDFVVAGV